MVSTAESERMRRAARRRATWTEGGIVAPGAAPVDPCDEMSPEERLAYLSVLSRRAWRLAGRPIPSVPRQELPGEVFEIRHGRA